MSYTHGINKCQNTCIVYASIYASACIYNIQIYKTLSMDPMNMHVTDNMKVKIDITSCNANNLLMWAAMTGRIEIVHTLIQSKIVWDYIAIEDAMVSAWINGHCEIVTMLCVYTTH